ncbi:MAG: sigma-70 family RNA polymerase sigma factor [Undibacterium sp.]|nr:sigma-70 family RNA polymerase sigma factor [Opitutaceae bacterium]
MAQDAARIQPGTPLVAWLHLVTRRTAIDAIRRESRRRPRKQAASEIAAMKPPSADWSRIEPLLDEALQTLDEPERCALLLRYF